MNLTYKKLVKLWSPLAVMWVVMALEQPAITAAISRLPSATTELACFGFAFSLALLIEGPVVQMLSAGTALSGNLGSYKKILKVMNHLALITLCLHLLLCIPAVFRFVAINIMYLPPALLNHSYICFVILIPWTPAIGYRRLWQGVMIKGEKSKQVPYVMYLRLTSAAIISTLGVIFHPFPGAILGGVTLSIGVLVGTFAAYYFAKPLIKDLKVNEKEDNLSYKGTVNFYIPLAITSTVTLGVRPLLNYGINKGIDPINSLAVFPIVIAYITLYTSITQSVQEIVIAEIKKSTYTMVKHFAFFVAVGTELLFFIILFIKPLWKFWFMGISDIPTHLIGYILPCLAIMALLPFLSGQIAWYRGVLVSERQTKTITLGVSLNIATMVFIIFFASAFRELAGVYLALIAYATAFVVEYIFLTFKCRKNIYNKPDEIINQTVSV